MDLPNNEDIGDLMFSAIEEGRADTVSELIDSYGFSYLREWSDGYNLLFEALWHGQSQVAVTLITKGCRVNRRDESRSKPTPLHLAVFKKDRSIIDLLLQKGASINCTYGWARETPLLTAVDYFDDTSVALLLSRGADVNAVTRDGRTGLHLAFNHRDEKVAKSLLEHGADVDAMDNNGETVLYQAVKCGLPPDLVELILSGRPSVHCKSNRAAVVLAFDEDDELMRVLFEYGFNILMDDEGHALFNAIRNDDIDRVRSWLDNEYDVRKPCKDRCTALHVAARYQKTEIARLLKDRGFDGNSKNELGKTPLDYALINDHWAMFNILIGSTNVNIDSELITAAVKKGHTKFVENLLKIGADVHARENNDCRYTLLHIAVQSGNIDTVKVLLDFHADVNSTDVINGYSALHYAVRERCFEISRILLDKGARGDMPAERGLTPLHFACQEDREDFVNLLLEYCADVNSFCKHGSPLHISSASANTDIVKMLLKHGADINCISPYGFTTLDCARLGPHLNLAAEYCIHKETFDFLFRRLVMMQAAGLYVCEQNMQLLEPKTFCLYTHGNISSRPTQINSDFPAECSKEIEMLKHEKIGDSNFPLYHVLAANESQLVNFSRNERLVQAFSSHYFKEKFPIYGNMIEWRFKLGVKRRVFEDKCEEYLRQFFPSYPLVCIHLIIGYLTNEDLRIFLDVCEPRPNLPRQ